MDHRNISGMMLGCFILASLAISASEGTYIITTPRQWRSGEKTQVCVFVPNPASSEGLVKATLYSTVYTSNNTYNHTLVPEVQILVPAGKAEVCQDIEVPPGDYYSASLRITGNIGGAEIDESRDISLWSQNPLTFIQTDRYLYQPGQKVQFRVLKLQGSEAQVATDSYEEIFVTSPSEIRIAQWKNVDNSAGLVHLSFQLADEPEQGSYTIHVKHPDGEVDTKGFKVEDYVLPRFEVKVKPPTYILATDEVFMFTVCAKYTFGQPVRGNVTLKVTNGQRRKCNVKLEKTEPITGCKDFNITAEEMRILDCNVDHLNASASVEEKGTEVAFSASVIASVTHTAINLKSVYEDNYKKPHLPYTLKVKATLPDNTPAAGVPVKVCTASMCDNKTTSADGLITAIVSSDNTNRIFMSTMNYNLNMRSTSFSKDLKHYYSPSNSSLLIQVPEDTLKCNAGKYTLPIFFSANNTDRVTVSVQIISRGKIESVASEKVELVSRPLPIDTQHVADTMEPLPDGITTGIIDLPIKLPPTAMPTVDVLVWYVRDDGEVVSDNAELRVEKCLGYSVNLTWSADQALPGDATKLTVVAKPNAICSVGVIDKSTELLSPEPDPITLDKIFDYVNEFNNYGFIYSQVNDNTYCSRKEEFEGQQAASIVAGEDWILPPRRFGHFYSYYVDALQMFDNAGLYVISDFTIETRPCERDGPSSGEFFGGSGGFGGGGNGHGPLPILSNITPANHRYTTGVSEPEEPEADVPRTDFPETWLWDLVTMPESGVSEQDLTLPNTITQWVGKAVCAHPGKGVGLSERVSITTFTPLFTDLTLPSSVKRGEVLPVKISLFNYLNESLPVTVTLGESAEYELVEDPEATQTGYSRQTCVGAEDKVVHTIKVRLQDFGNVNLTVSAFVDFNIPDSCGSGRQPARRDTLIKPIKVHPEGFLKENTFTKYVCAEELASGDDTFEKWQVEPPQNIVPESARGWVTAVGDLLVPSIENLGHLIRMPYGCGEQNMVNFAPNIYILQYLKATNQGTPEIIEKLLRFMRTGYQRELLYRRNNGSYSAFGNADYSGSTWLTAFVLKSFAQAQEYISTDEEALEQTRMWLSKSDQDKNGCILSVGKVFSKGLKGGLADNGSPVGLTAYILTSLLEAGTPANADVVTNTIRCILADTTRDPYTLALKAYALALANHSDAVAIMDQLIGIATVEKNAMYWFLPEGPYRSNTLAVETAGYAILAMMALDPEEHELKAREIVKWVTSKRNGQGGFFSTQDTVVALQALASFESHTFQGPLDLMATVTAQDFSHDFFVNEDNKFLQQFQTLPTFPTNIDINMVGTGCAVLQAVLRYNIPDPEPSDAFSLRVTATNDPRGGCKKKRLDICTSYLLPDGKSNMAVIEVDLVSGFIPEKEDLKDTVALNRGVVKRYEVDGSKVSFYIEELTGQDVCVNFDILREIEVEETKPGTVTVFDYYQPEFAFSQTYTFPHREGCSR